MKTSVSVHKIPLSALSTRELQRRQDAGCTEAPVVDTTIKIGFDSSLSPEGNYKAVNHELLKCHDRTRELQDSFIESTDAKQVIQQDILNAENKRPKLEADVDDELIEQSVLDDLNTEMDANKKELERLGRLIETRLSQKEAEDKQINRLTTRQAMLKKQLLKKYAEPHFHEAMKHVFYWLPIAMGAAGLMKEDYMPLDLVKVLNYYAGNKQKCNVDAMEFAGKEHLTDLILDEVLKNV